MRSLFIAILLLQLCSDLFSQSPAIQWKKCFGGSFGDVFNKVKPATDGGYIVAGYAGSNDGDLPGNKGGRDAWITKLDAAGNSIWHKNFGGSLDDVADDIAQTPDGGYVVVGGTASSDGDVSINKGNGDLWIFRLDPSGNLIWQKTYGGSNSDHGFNIYNTPDGGFIIGGQTTSDDGDVTNQHRVLLLDAWIVKTDAVGNIQWQSCYGGTITEGFTRLIPTADGGYFFATLGNSTDGDISCGTGSGNIWLVKISNTGNIQWNRCWGGNGTELPNDVKQTSDGGFIITGYTSSDDLVGSYGNSGDAFLLKTDALGIEQWYVVAGGSGRDESFSLEFTVDGGYLIAGSTGSPASDVCVSRGFRDYWLVKINAAGVYEWQKTYGGALQDIAYTITGTSDGGFIVGGSAISNDGDVVGQHGVVDGWIFKLMLTGAPVLPDISIAADDRVICPNQSVRFIATIINGGLSPVIQWKLNGADIGPNNDTIYLNTLLNGDIVTCELSSNSPCVSNRFAYSNAITISVDPSETPANFLPADTAICDYETILLRSTGSYATYLWNNNDITPSLSITQPGLYWLKVTTASGCPGRDSINVSPKDCIRGFYMPTAFSPNNDGKNDVLKPILGGRIVQYNFTVVNRWGQVVFQTSDTRLGWDGTIKGLKQNSDVYIWICRYQFEGESPVLGKGTAVIIR